MQKREPVMPFVKYETGITFLLSLSHVVSVRKDILNSITKIIILL